MRVTELILELLGHKAKIKGVSERLLCCCGNLLCQVKYLKLFNNYWELVLYHFQNNKSKIMVVLIHQTIGAKIYGNCFEPP